MIQEDKDYCDLKTVLKLKSLGMNVYTSFKGIDVIKNISIYEVLKWLREEKNLYICPSVITDYQDDWQYSDIVYWSFIVVNIESGDSIYREYEHKDEKRFESYELAAIAGIEYVIDNLI